MKQHSLYYEICDYLDKAIKNGEANKKELQDYMRLCGYDYAFNTNDMIDSRLSKKSHMVKLPQCLDQGFCSNNEEVA